MYDISFMANVAEIGGGFAILVSLLYVGYQIRQSNRIASASALQSVLDRFADRTLNQYVEHPELSTLLVRGHRCDEELAIEDRVIFDAWVLREILQMQRLMTLFGAGQWVACARFTHGSVLSYAASAWMSLRSCAITCSRRSALANPSA